MASADSEVLPRGLHALGGALDYLEPQAATQEEVRLTGDIFPGLGQRVELAEVPHLGPDPVHALEQHPRADLRLGALGRDHPHGHIRQDLQLEGLALGIHDAAIKKALGVESCTEGEFRHRKIRDT